MMETSDHKIGKLFLVFAGLCFVAIPFVVMSAFSSATEPLQPVLTATSSAGLDEGGQALYKSLEEITQAYLEGVSSERTLTQYYDRRQYPGSPPYIPHKVEKGDTPQIECLACHAKGGWSAELKHHTPLTPHPEQTACVQCHVEKPAEGQFVEIDWMSVRPPRLGRAHLPGGPPPIPHGLQMRGNCVACHVGPGAVTEIRVDHPSRGSCRQCHVPDLYSGSYERPSDY